MNGAESSERRAWRLAGSRLLPLAVLAGRGLLGALDAVCWNFPTIDCDRPS